MAYIPSDDVILAWKAASEKTWQGLREALIAREGDSEELDEQSREVLLGIAEEMAADGRDFPESEFEFRNLVEERMGRSLRQ